MHLSPDTLQALIGLIRQWTGLSLTADKDYLVHHRLAPVVRSCGFDSYEQLLLRLQGGAPRIQEAVVEAITTKETSFFRDEWLFDTIGQSVLPQLKALNAAPRRVRLLSAGSSTGQEAYSLAMLVREFLDLNRDLAEADFSVVGIDISGEAVDAARAGVYTQGEVQRGLSEARLRRHFRREGPGWVVGDPLKKLVQFRTWNLLQPLADLGVFDLVLCRNVLIYFDDRRVKQVVGQLASMLEPDGALVVGVSESLLRFGTELRCEELRGSFFYRVDARGPAAQHKDDR